MGRGDTATCHPDWGGQSTLQGLPLSRSTTPIFLPLGLHAAIVGVTESWPPVLGLLSRGRGERDSVQGRGTQLFKGPGRAHGGEGALQGATGCRRKREGTYKGKEVGEEARDYLDSQTPSFSQSLLQ